MNIFSTDYFKKYVDDIVEKMVFDSDDMEHIKGCQEDMKGKKAEEIIVDLCNKDKPTDEEKIVLKSLFKKHVKSAKLLSNTYKSDIQVFFADGSKSDISIKNTKCASVGGLEITKNSFCDFFKDKILFNVLEKFELVKYNPTDFSCKYASESKYFEKFISDNIKKYLKFVITGRGNNLPPDSIIFIDKDKNLVYISTIDEYIDSTIKYGSKKSLNTYTNLTRTSGKYCNLKIKIMNPLRNKELLKNHYIK